MIVVNLTQEAMVVPPSDNIVATVSMTSSIVRRTFPTMQRIVPLEL